jgi:hypothetical protein
MLSARKILRADMFCLAWVVAVAKSVREFADSAKHEAIGAYLALHHPDLRDLTTRNRSESKAIDSHLLSDFFAGQQRAASVRLHRGVGSTAEQPQLTDGSRQ